MHNWQLSEPCRYCYPRMPTKNLQEPLVPVQHPADGVQAVATPDRRTLLHPASGTLILGLDWLLFSGTVFSGGLAVWITGLTGLIIGGIGTGLIQRRISHDSRTAAALKGLAAGFIVGAPFPIAGTAVGGMVLVLSGLDRLLKRRTAPEN